MTSWGRAVLYLALIILLTTTSIEALDIESAIGQPCFNISTTVPVDLEWAATITTMYSPLGSRLQLYRAVEDLLRKDPGTVSEGSVYYDSCLTWNSDSSRPGHMIVKGFDGLTRAYQSKVVAPNMEVFELQPVEGTGFSGTAYTTLTDNKTFRFVSMCTAKGEMAWGVGSTIPNLPKETVKLILEHAKSLGFKEDQFTELRYDTCKIAT